MRPKSVRVLNELARAGQAHRSLPRHSLSPRPRRDFLGCQVDTYTLDEAVALATGAMRERTRLQHGDVNVAKFMAFRRDRELLRYTQESDLICPDGMGIVWGCRLMGVPLRERVTGIDMMMRLVEACARDGFKPYFLGARQEVVDDTVARVRRMFPGIEIAGWRNGYFGPADEAGVVADIRASGADCLFVGISSPMKERFLNQHRDALGVPVQLGVGGAFDVLSGHIRRAPPWMQRAGLEWFFRFAQEPRRLWRRYLTTNTRFAGVLAMAFAGRISRPLLARLGRRS